MKGKLVFGAGEGGMFVPKYDFKSFFGWEPFPGTLNLRLGPKNLKIYKALEKRAVKIKAPRGFGKVKALRAKIGHVECGIIFPELTHYRNTAEIIAPEALRGKLGLKLGDIVKVDPLLP